MAGTENFQNVNLLKSLENKLFTDVTVIVGTAPDQKQYELHKVVLDARSEFFHAALKSDYNEGKEGIVTLPEVKPVAFDALLRWMYSGSTFDLFHPSSKDHLASIYAASDYLRLPGFAQYFIERVVPAIGMELTLGRPLQDNSELIFPEPLVFIAQILSIAPHIMESSDIMRLVKVFLTRKRISQEELDNLIAQKEAAGIDISRLMSGLVLGYEACLESRLCEGCIRPLAEKVEICIRCGKPAKSKKT